MSATTDFDIGPLTWVKPEIDLALKEAQEKLDSFKVGSADTTLLKHCYTYLHQASGALQMVGLDGAGRFADAMEKLLGALEKQQIDANVEHIELLKDSITSLSKYLNGLAAGEADIPLKLFPDYKKLLEARGVEKIVESELFFPDLTARVPARVQAVNFNEADLPKLAKQQRFKFQQGLLKWLRQENPEQGLELMRQALSAIERTQTFAVHRSFWWSAVALTESLAHRGVTTSLYVKQLCARIDQQIRRLAEGSPKVAERLLRDVLYFIAKSEPVSDHVRQVKHTFDLHKYLPPSTLETSEAAIEAQRLQPLLRGLQETVSQVKEVWLKFTTGNKDSSKIFHEQLSKLKDEAGVLENQALTGLLEKIHGASAYMQDHEQAFNELVAMEMATALLLVENTLENYARITDEFVTQAKVQGRRVEASVKGENIEFDDVPLLDEISRKAQEKLLMAQVAQEIQSNLRQIEQTLDAFFRDPSKRTELPSLSGYIKQILGALRILELERAADLLKHAEEMVQRFSSADYEVRQSELELLAEVLSSLGFYIEGVKNGREEAFTIIEPMLKRFPGYRARTAELNKEVPEEAIPTGTVEAELGDQKRLLSSQFTEWQQTTDTDAREQMRHTLTSLQQDADLMADTTLKEKATEAIQLLEQSGENQTEALMGAIQALTAPAVPSATPSDEVTKLLDASQEAVDADLLETYIQEAQEVLATIDTNLAIGREQPHNKEALVTIRRGFHTLKGSGRMVGLTTLGEVAWGVEQILNKWLEEEKSITTDLAEFINQAQHEFSAWVLSLKETGSASVDADDLLSQADSLKTEGTKLKKPELEAEELEQAQLSALESDDPSLPVDAWSDDEPAELDFSVADSFPEDAAEPGTLFLEISPEPATSPELSPNEHENFAEQKGWQDEVLPEILPEYNLPDPSLDQPHVFAVDSNLTPDANLADDEIIAGGVILNQDLYNVFMAEADEHLRTLQTEFMQLKENPQASINHEFMRAAHTLCGTSRTVGFEEPGDLSYALEQWLRQLLETPKLVSEKELTVMEDSIAALNKMVHAIRHQKIPRPAKQLIRSLKGMLKNASSAGSTKDTDDAAMSEMVGEPAEQNSPAMGLVTTQFSAAQSAAELSTPRPDWSHLSLNLDEDSSVDFTAQAGAEQQALPAWPDPESPVASFQDDALWGTAEPPLEDAANVVNSPDQLGNGGLDLHPADFSFTPFQHEVPAADTDPDIDMAQPESAENSVDLAPPVTAVEQPPQERRVLRDDIDQQLLSIFLEEAEELFPLMGGSLRDWRANPDAPPPEPLQRALHTLKGSARMAGAMRLGELTHTLEEQILEADDTPGPKAENFFDDLELRYDRLSDALERLKKGLPEDEEQASVTPVAVATTQKPLAAEPPPQLESATAKAVLRVAAQTVDRLVNEAGEVSIARSRVEGEMQGFKQSLFELTENVMRLRKQLREVEIQAESQMQSSLSHAHELHAAFDPLEFDRFTRFQELTRIMAESVNDVSTVQQNLLNNLDETEAALLAQARMTKELQQSLMRIRMVHLSSISERLHRIVRQTAKELGKSAQLEIRGGQVELDRSVLEKITAPFEHLLRNAIAHGLEDPATREANGKTPTGLITLLARQEGNEIVLMFSDDGAGIDLQRIRAKAVERGLLQENAEPTDTQLTELIFNAGFSTATEVTQVSGRGIGMDVVRNEIAALGGRIEVSSTAGAGTVFTIYLPLTLAVTQAVMVRAGNELYALPSAMIEQVQEFKAHALSEIHDNKEISWQNNRYPYHYLPRLLGDDEHMPVAQNYTMIMLLKSGAQRAAVQVDELIGNQEIVVKNIGPQLARVAGVAGATVLGNGKVVLIINPVQLAHREVSSVALGKTLPAKAEPATVAPLIMVVDDSLTVRKITGRLLAKEGYQVLTAKDGVDALQLLADHHPDVMLVDIEMPRMDGFELTKNIRANSATAHIPIIMITSRTAEKHRNYAKELGVDAYLGKPYQEEELLGHIARFVHKGATLH